MADGLQFTAVADKARYTVASVSTEIRATWSFESARTDGEQALPLSVVRFTPALSERNTSKARASVAVPVTVRGAAAGRNPASLRVYYSTDSGHWQRATVQAGGIRVTNPAAGGTVSFKAEASDRRGNTVVQTIKDAYRTAQTHTGIPRSTKAPGSSTPAASRTRRDAPRGHPCSTATYTEWGLSSARARAGPRRCSRWCVGLNRRHLGGQASPPPRRGTRRHRLAPARRLDVPSAHREDRAVLRRRAHLASGGCAVRR
ncbi:hypothetical protein RKD38_006984 [Streptomyces ambofaciens]